jgi:hypothetical protein
LTAFLTHQQILELRDCNPVVKAKLESSNLISDAEIHSWRQSFKSNLREGSNTLNLAEVQTIVQSFGETIDAAEHDQSKCFEWLENVDRIGGIDCEDFEVFMKMLKDLTLSRGFCSRGSALSAAKIFTAFSRAG